MARRRYISTETSTDKKFNSLINDFGYFAGLLYELMIPHAEDDCTITADPDEIRMKVVPGFKKISNSDIKKAIIGIITVKLMFYLDESTLCFPSESFYKYQSYIPDSKRVTRIYTEEHRESPQNAEEHRLPSPSLSPSPSPYNNNGDFFEQIWKLYPRKEGKGSISKTQKEKLFNEVGAEQLKRCVERYKTTKQGTEAKYLKQGSTFFNSGYVDYLDKNYEEPPKQQTIEQKKSAKQILAEESDRILREEGAI